jgi:hypothetical protein
MDGWKVCSLKIETHIHLEFPWGIIVSQYKYCLGLLVIISFVERQIGRVDIILENVV